MENKTKERIGVVILNWNGTEDTIECLNSLSYSNQLLDIYLLDNGSDYAKYTSLDEYISEEYNAGQNNIHIIRSESNLGFAKGNNYIVNKIKDKYQYVLLLNNDTVVPSNTIKSMYKLISNHRFIGVTCEIYEFYDKRRLWNAGGYFTKFWERKYYSQEWIEKEKKEHSFIQVEFITGCALLLDTDYIDKYGLFTEAFFHGEEDFQFCYMVKKNNQRLGVDLSSKLYHKVGQSIKNSGNKKDQINKMIVHFSNRLIDLKLLKSYPLWTVWKELYLCALYWKLIRSEFSKDDAADLVKSVRKISTKYNGISYALFQQIIKDPKQVI